jgi:hypothetical protein
MCIHELDSCAWCPTPEQTTAQHEADIAAMERAIFRALQAPSLPAPHAVRVVPVPTTSMHEPDHDPRVEWDPHRHRIGTNVYPSFVPVERPEDIDLALARLLSAHPDWVR